MTNPSTATADKIQRRKALLLTFMFNDLLLGCLLASLVEL
jgi:hypothetical protein